MGSLTGGLLKTAGADVHLYSTNREHMEKIRQNGLIMDGIGKERVIRINATTHIEEVGAADLIIIFVKSYDTRTAAAEARKIAGENTLVLTLQNGIGNVEILEELYGKEKVLAGTTDAAANIPEPGRVRHTAGGSVYIGSPGGEVTPQIHKIVDLMQAAGFNAQATHNAIGMIWTKLILNLAINPPGTILRTVCRGLIDNDYSRALMAEIVNEALQVSGKKGIHLLHADMVQAAYDLAEKNAASQNSMLQDSLKGKKTEIDFMSGAMVKEGEKFGIDLPVNRAMTNLVKALTFKR